MALEGLIGPGGPKWPGVLNGPDCLTFPGVSQGPRRPEVAPEVLSGHGGHKWTPKGLRGRGGPEGLWGSLRALNSLHALEFHEITRS